MENVKSFKDVLEENELNYLCSIFLNSNKNFDTIQRSELSEELIYEMQEEFENRGKLDVYWDVDFELVQNKIRQLHQTEVVRLMNTASLFKDKILIVNKKEVVQTKEIYNISKTMSFYQALTIFEIMEQQVSQNLIEISESDELFFDITWALSMAGNPMAAFETKKISETFYPIEVWSKGG
jgi:hypothetical protein